MATPTTHAEQTADGLATWIERRQHTPAELRQILRLALRDAEVRGERLASLVAPLDPLAEPIPPVEAAPLNAHVGRRVPVSTVTNPPCPSCHRPTVGGVCGPCATAYLRIVESRKEAA
jgi:hypothetical protein